MTESDQNEPVLLGETRRYDIKYNRYNTLYAGEVQNVISETGVVVGMYAANPNFPEFTYIKIQVTDASLPGLVGRVDKLGIRLTSTRITSNQKQQPNVKIWKNN